MSRWKRIFRVIGFPLLIAVIAIVSAVGIATMIYGRRVENRIVEIRKAGDPVSLADLPAANMPDGEDADIIYGDIFEDASNFMKRYEILGTREWVDVYETSTMRRERIVQIFLEARPIISRLRTAVEEHPKCRFPIQDVGPERNFCNLSPRLAKLRNTSRLISANTRFHTIEGRMDEAVRSCELQMRLAASFTDDPMTIVFLVRTAQIAISEDSIRYILENGSIDDIQAKRLYDSLGALDPSAEYVKALKGDRALFIVWPSTIRMPEPLDSMRRLAYLEYMNQQISTADLSYADAKARGELLAQQKSRGYPGYRDSLVSATDRIKISRDQAQAVVNGGRISLALAAYNHRHGSYPETLDVLRSRLDWEISNDPFTGKDFVYKREGRGFLLYSVGRDLRDDGGKNPDPNDSGDIVWRMTE